MIFQQGPTHYRYHNDARIEDIPDVVLHFGRISA
jgi:hypothetical protein